MLRDIVLTAAAVLSFFSAQAHAGLVSLDSRFGPDTITLDTVTGLEWLDLPVVEGISSWEMDLALRPGGRFEGFRLATPDDVCDLVTPLFRKTSCNQVLRTGRLDYEPAKALVGLMGWSLPGGYGWLRGFIDPPRELNYHDAWGMSLGLWPGDDIAEMDYQMVPYPHDGHIGDGIFLIRRAGSAPEPGAIFLVGIGLIGLIVGRRRPRRDNGSIGSKPFAVN